MTKVITFSRIFPKNHSCAGMPTFFVEKILHSLSLEPKYRNTQNKFFTDAFRYSLSEIGPYDIKNQTIRAGDRLMSDDCFSPRIWTGMPYRSPQFAFSGDIKLLHKIPIRIYHQGNIMLLNNTVVAEYGSEIYNHVAFNDGLTSEQLKSWFQDDLFYGTIYSWIHDKSYERWGLYNG